MALELNNMAGTYRAENRFEEAGEHYLRGLELTDPDGDEITYSFLVSNLGIVHEALGRLPEAVDCQRSALAQALRLGRRTLVGSYHRRLAESLLKLGDVEEAGGHLRESLGIAQESGDRMNQILVLIALGRFHLADGEPDAAVACGREAADLSRLRDAPLLAAQALDVAAAGHLAGARLHAARESWQQALVALNDLNQPFAAELLARLAENG
jgi:tetratricopeptide (TPR) repeat protein